MTQRGEGESERVKPLRISFHALVAGITALLLLAGLATIGLVISNELMQRSFQQVRADAETIPAVDELSLTLLNYDRLSALSLKAPSSNLSPLAAASRRSALSQLQHLRAFVTGPSEERLYRTTTERVRGYLAEHRRLERQRPTPDALQTSTSNTLDIALSAVAQYRTYNIAQVDDEELTARRWLTSSRVVQGVVLVILLLTTVLLGITMSRGLDQPLSELDRSMARFAHGELSARARLGGTTELTAIGQAFNHMAERLELAQKSRFELVASVVHDLRNPLAALKLSVGIDREAVSPQIAARGQRLVAAQVNRLERMVDDLLDAARLQTGQLSLSMQEVDLRDSVRASVELYGDDPSHPIVMELPSEPLGARCDPMRIEQVMNNLLSNAIKYSPQGGEIRVAVTASRGWAHVSVSDQGVGIAQEDRERVFESFGRGASAQDVAPGTGLGLWAARRIALAHGGELDFDSIRGVGSTFRFHLPLPSAQGSAPEDQHD